MQTYYHITALKNLNSILRYGLLPAKGRLSHEHHEQIPYVYMFKTLEDIHNAETSRLIKDIIRAHKKGTELCILKLTLPDSFPVQKRKGQDEWQSTEVIPPRYITYLREP